MAYPNLAAEIARNGVSVRDIADCAGVCPKTVYNWFNGNSRPSIEQAKSIQMKFFESCELTYLFAN